jgi:pimeloyl-ACP methyl ester carboxylesterase
MGVPIPPPLLNEYRRFTVSTFRDYYRARPLSTQEASNAVFLDLTVSSFDYLEQLSALMRDPVFYDVDSLSREHGEPVLLLPGYFAGDWAMAPMTRWLRRIGYSPYHSGIDVNLGCPREKLERLEARVAGIAGETGSRVAIIGHSLGGVFARSLGGELPGMVSRVIGLGAPIRHDWDAMNRRIGSIMQSAAGLWQTLAGAPANCGTASCDCGFARSIALSAARANAFTSIHSREDDVVDWRSCLDAGGNNYQVRGRHVGLVVNREVYRLIARILAGRRNLPAIADAGAASL